MDSSDPLVGSGGGGGRVAQSLVAELTVGTVAVVAGSAPVSLPLFPTAAVCRSLRPAPPPLPRGRPPPSPCRRRRHDSRLSTRCPVAALPLVAVTHAAHANSTPMWQRRPRSALRRRPPPPLFPVPTLLQLPCPFRHCRKKSCTRTVQTVTWANMPTDGGGGASEALPTRRQDAVARVGACPLLAYGCT